ncbi:MFS transporter [Legionella sp. CNM-4043-24]|uniref:MFS transporter n=1 Tax=Legionella sp. CNM-4043-24 TaxID=3421646 RepID=UPI00403A8A0E
MKYPWSKSVFPIAAIFSFRMLGLFMLIPVFTAFARHLDGATPTLMGIALGSYGLSQGILQMPFGLLSDRYGRKAMITLGLLLFAAGSLLGAVTHSIYGMIFARILQGTGAVGSVLIALLADLTTEAERTKAMAVIGVTIGVSFSLAMVLSPAITHQFGLPGIFFFTAALALCGLLLLHVIIPTPSVSLRYADSETKTELLKSVFFNPHLQRLNIGIFLQHAILTSTFFVVPLLLLQQQEQGRLMQQWHFYLPLMIVAFLLMVPAIILAEKKQKVKPVFLTAVLTTCLAQGLLAFFYPSWYALCALLLLYFVAFNILEANLPSLISKQANPGNKGTAMGVYSSFQFLGIFTGGLLAGLLFQYAAITGLFLVNALLGALWFMIARRMKVTKKA